MAQRTVKVAPDSLVRTLGGQEIAVVSRDRQMQVLCDFAVICDIAGGTISSIYGRTQIDDGEFVTTAMLVHWRDRTDAKPQQEEAVAFEEELVLVDGEAVTVADDPSGFLPADAEVVEPFIGDNGVVAHAEERLAAATVE